MSERDILKWAANRAANEPVLLGYDLREYRNVNDATDVDLASVLDCSVDALVCLSLCRRPNPDAPSFHADVQQIARHCGVNPERLAAILREVDSLRTIRQAPTPMVTDLNTGFLAAARDRKQKRSPKKRSGKKRSR